MQFRHRLAMTLPPVLLRVVLGVTFLWLGLGQVMTEVGVQGADAAALANMGVSALARGGGGPSNTTPAVRPTPRDEPQPPADDSEPGLAPEDIPQPPPGSEEGGGGGAEGSDDGSWSDGGGLAHTAGRGLQPYALVLAVSPGQYTAADFPNPVAVKRLYASVALAIRDAADPGLNARSEPKMRLWPPALAQDRLPLAWAWAAVVVSIVGGALLILGVFTRFWALLLAVMVGLSIWLTGVGPALQSGQTHLGFLPAHDVFDAAAWQGLLWQFALLMSALALLLSGPGPVSIDHGLFAPMRAAPAEDDEAGDDDKKSKKKK